MSTEKVFFPENLKFLRKRKNLSQEAIAKLLNISRSKHSALENGQIQNPQLEDLICIAAYFKISIDSLLKVDLSKLGELKLRELEAGNDVYMSGGKIRVLAITVNEKNRENVEYVPKRAKAGYAAGYNDPEYIASLPRYSLPNMPANGTYRIFPTMGDSMLPIPEGSDIITQYIDDWTAIKPQTLCIVILRNSQDFVFKMVTVLEDNKFLLESYNQVYQPYTVEAADVLEVWKYYRHQTNVIPDRPSEIKEIKSLIEEVLQEVKKKS